MLMSPLVSKEKRKNSVCYQFWLYRLNHCTMMGLTLINCVSNEYNRRRSKGEDAIKLIAKLKMEMGGTCTTPTDGRWTKTWRSDKWNRVRPHTADQMTVEESQKIELQAHKTEENNGQISKKPIPRSERRHKTYRITYKLTVDLIHSCKTLCILSLKWIRNKYTLFEPLRRNASHFMLSVISNLV